MTPWKWRNRLKSNQSVPVGGKRSLTCQKPSYVCLKPLPQSGHPGL